MSNPYLDSAIRDVIPTVPDPIPESLRSLTERLYHSSKSKISLKPQEELARYHISAIVAANFKRSQLGLMAPAIDTVPLSTRSTKELIQVFQNTLVGASSVQSTPKKKTKENSPVTPSPKKKVGRPKGSKGMTPFMKRLLEKDTGISLSPSPSKRQKMQSISDSDNDDNETPEKNDNENKIHPNLKLLTSIEITALCNKFQLEEDVTKDVVRTFQRYFNKVSNEWIMICGLIINCYFVIHHEKIRDSIGSRILAMRAMFKLQNGGLMMTDVQSSVDVVKPLIEYNRWFKKLKQKYSYKETQYSLVNSGSMISKSYQFSKIQNDIQFIEWLGEVKKIPSNKHILKEKTALHSRQHSRFITSPSINYLPTVYTRGLNHSTLSYNALNMSIKREFSSETYDRLENGYKKNKLEAGALDDVSMDSSPSDSDYEKSDILLPIDSGISNGKWHETIKNVVKSVVSIHFAQTASFDCDPAIVSEATGFVVDAERGIILTNRHVVGAGPFWGYAIFDNHEEAVVKPIYRDPVHDFGFLKFNPEEIKYMKVQSLDLRPDLAQVGCEIRVVGNDNGEKLSILAGFISRLDRNAPEYGGLTYNDFNTEYIQAAASASGGSSGSPVVDVNGNAVALQAGGSTDASTDFFLPLYRVLRALKCIQDEKKITRGTIQVQWILRPFDECRRLGLSEEAEKKARDDFPKSIGLLVAEVILPEGPADKLIEEGDSLISINGKSINSFITVDEILDSSVGEEIEVVLQRGGEYVKVKTTVGDLHAITPNRYLNVAGASFNDMSYQMARIYAIPVKGVFINNATGSFFLEKSEPTGWVLDSVNDIDVENLDELVKVMKTIPDKAKVSIKFRHISDLHSPSIQVVYIDRHWCTTFRLATRNDETGLWDFQDLEDALPAEEEIPKSVKFIDIPIEHPKVAQLSRSFMLVTAYIHVPVDAFPTIRRRGYGVVIDAERGYLIVSRNIVPHDCLDVQLTVAESLIISATVEFLHPTQNFAILKYDPKLIKAKVQTPVFSETPLERGNKVVFVGYNYNLRVVSAETKVSDIASVNVPRHVLSPRYRGTNLESVSIDSSLSNDCSAGIIANTDGTVRGLWLSFLGEGHKDADTVYKMGIDVSDINNIIKSFQNGIKPIVKTVDAEFFALSIAQARNRGVADEWIEKYENSGKDRLQILAVNRVPCPENPSLVSNLKIGDIILAMEDSPVFSINDINKYTIDKDTVSFKVVRKRQELEIKSKTVEVKSTDHLVFWGGAVLQAPHHAVRQSMMNLPSQVYVTSRARGSPARSYGISSTNFITHLDGIPTPTLEKFVEVARTIPDNTYCKVRLVSFDNIPFAISVKTNYHYFPTGELKKNHESNTWLDIEYNEENKESSVKNI
ncbi:hypothetical protein WICMUC_002172 [Wickerhamomyces mucosus]|uniref:Pro-apoptotic serine protease NMA111 n=1 Tax=Wickerhamomyces mucosus TaxID=1378264 RepID=A0A9P8PR44_9ASCO|nr:hypothetical protein WICMUC_002172 [Wickerhamomyces mucosus]